MYIVIRAGGIGTRLWPLSRSQKPKQLHALVSQKTLLQEAVDRVLDIVPKENVYVSCNQDAELSIRNDLKSVLQENYIVEPDLRDTTAAVGLETIMIAKHDPKAIIASLGSDHVISNTKEFQRILEKAEKIIEAKPDHIICIGVKPTGPDTGYGYIELGETIEDEVYKVNSFKEKPDAATAKQFIESNNYLWNTNMFVWRADTILNLFKEHQTSMYEKLQSIQADNDRVDEIYPTLEKVAVDYAIIEKTDKIFAIPGDFGWNDIGDWARLKDELSDSTTVNYSHGDHLDIDSKNSLVFSDTDRLIATIGLNDIVIVDTGDALLVCDKNRSQDVKNIVDELKKQKRTDLL